MEPPTKRRRVPQELRKRSERSCDYCRKHRCKCEPSPDAGTCLACHQGQLPCTYAAPRKTRLCVSPEELSDRYRCLDAIVKAAFPDDATGTSEDLIRLGTRKGYAMPDLSDAVPLPPEVVTSHRIEDELRNPPADIARPSSPKDRDAAGDSSRQNNANADSFAPESPGLVRDPAGQTHHIGPSGSLAFFAELRNLIARRGSSSHRALQNPSQFTQDDTAKTLEHENATDIEDTQLPRDGPNDDSPDSLSNHSASAQNLDQRDLAEHVAQLPPPMVMQPLLQSYFRRVHPDFPLFHEPSFEDEFESFILRPRCRHDSASSAQLLSRMDWGWLACLHMILVFGSLNDTSQSRSDCRAIRKKSVPLVRSLLPRIVSKCTVSNVQALVLLSLYFHNHSERNAAWNLLGTATRTALALGLHRTDVSLAFRPIERETRKRVFCTLYSFEQFLCASLDRPDGISAHGVHPSPPREGFFSDGHGVGTSFAKLDLELQAILASARSPKSSPAEILKALSVWKDMLPPHLNLPTAVNGKDIMLKTATSRGVPSLDVLESSISRQTPGQIRAILLLHIQYHHIAVIVTRSALLHAVAISYNHTFPESASEASCPPMPEPKMEPSDACIHHACQLSLLVILLQSHHLLNGLSALDTFYAYSAAMVLLLRLLRIVPESPATSRNERNIQGYLHQIIVGIRTAVNNTRKSATMTRFASVMNTFAGVVIGGVSDSSQQIPPDSRNGHRTYNEAGNAVGSLEPAPSIHAPVFQSLMGRDASTATSLRIPLVREQVPASNENHFPDHIQLTNTHPLAPQACQATVTIDAGFTLTDPSYLYSGFDNLPTLPGEGSPFDFGDIANWSELESLFTGGHMT